MKNTCYNLYFVNGKFNMVLFFNFYLISQFFCKDIKKYQQLAFMRKKLCNFVL